MADSFVFYKSFYEAIKSMPDEAEQAKAYKYICEYVFEEKEPQGNDFARAMFYMVKVNIDNAKKRYNASVENGKKGGAPKGNQNAKKQPKNNLETTQKQPKNNLNVNDNVNDNDNVNVNDNKEKNNKKEKQLITYDDTAATTIYNFLESNFGRTIAPIEVEQLNGWLKEFNEDVLKFAIELCCNANARTFNYLNAILKSWKSKGFKKLEECKNENIKRVNKLVREEPIPEWFGKEQETKRATKEEVEEMKMLLSEYQDP